MRLPHSVLSQRHPRRAIAALWTLVIFALLAVLLAVTTTEILASRRIVDRRNQQLQAGWLARAGLELAVARLLTQPEGYEGESAVLIPGSKVTVQVRRENNAPNLFIVTSEARYPATGKEAVARSVSRRFRRIVEKERVRLEAVADDLPTKAKPVDSRE